MSYQIIQGDNRQTLKTLPDNSVDAIVTDPPYGIDFLGKSWDANTGALETYQECLRVLKPGGHILAFSAARTYHHLAVTLEQAGFEIRDQIMWIYASGFPKSQDIGRSIQRSIGVKEYEKIVDTTKNAGFGQTDHARVRAGEEWSTPAKQVGQVKVTDPEAKDWEGWGTALKPAHEPIALARKPMKDSIAKNAQKWGVGALNIDATRIPTDEIIVCGAGNGDTFNKLNAENNIDGPGTGIKINKDMPKWQQAEGGRFPSNVLGEIPDYQKYFYCPKVSRRERHMGFDEQNSVKTMMEHMNAYYVDSQNQPFVPQNNDPYMIYIPGKGKVYPHGLKHEYSEWCKNNNVNPGNVGNNHPTVKPVALMEYLIKLVTPPGGTVLDPFNGSGSTGMAAVGLGYNYVGCELDANYVEISKKRIDAWTKKDLPVENPIFKELFETDVQP